MLNWVVELGQYAIDVEPRTAIKSQALTDFIIECTTQTSDRPSEVEWWEVLVDGSTPCREIELISF